MARSSNKKFVGQWKYVGLGALAVASIAVAGFAVARPDLQPDAGAAAQFSPEPVALPGFAPPAEPLIVTRSAPGAPLRTLFAGDSLTDGFFASTQEESFKELMIDQLGPVDLTTAALAKQTLSTVSKVTDVPAGLDLAVVELGTNDVGIPTPVTEFTEQYKGLLVKIKERSPKVAILCAGTWVQSGALYDQVIEEACKSAGGRYVSLAGLYQNSGLHGPEGISTWKGTSDWFHPNNSGHRAISAELMSAIQVK